MHAGHEAQADGAAYGLCNLPLILGSQARLPRVLDAAHLGHILGHHGEVLQGVSAEAGRVWEEGTRRTLYSVMGLMPRVSKTSLEGVLRASFHFFCSTPDRSCGA